MISNRCLVPAQAGPDLSAPPAIWQQPQRARARAVDFCGALVQQTLERTFRSSGFSGTARHRNRHSSSSASESASHLIRRERRRDDLQGRAARRHRQHRKWRRTRVRSHTEELSLAFRVSLPRSYSSFRSRLDADLFRLNPLSIFDLARLHFDQAIDPYTTLALPRSACTASPASTATASTSTGVQARMIRYKLNGGRGNSAAPGRTHPRSQSRAPRT